MPNENFTLDTVWGQRTAGINIEADAFRPYTHEDIIYLENRYPFIQIVNTEGEFEDQEVEFITSKSGWKIFYYGDAMCLSPGEFLFGGYDYLTFLNKILGRVQEDEGGEGGESGEGSDAINPGKGTVIKQTYDTMCDMVEIAMKKGWAGIEIVDGTPIMKWAAWAIAKEKEFYLFGYDPDLEDEKRQQRLVKQKLLTESLQPSI